MLRYRRRLIVAFCRKAIGAVNLAAFWYPERNRKTLGTIFADLDYRPAVSLFGSPHYKKCHESKHNYQTAVVDRLWPSTTRPNVGGCHHCSNSLSSANLRPDTRRRRSK